MNALTLKNNKAMLYFLIIAALGVVAFLMPSLAMAKDFAASAKQDITDTFGPGSVAWYVIMLLEILAAGYSYIRTKNLAVMMGIIALILFFNAATGLI